MRAEREATAVYVYIRNLSEILRNTVLHLHRSYDRISVTTESEVIPMKERILIVDDEAEIADLMALYLEHDGYQVQKAYTAQQALDYLAAEPVQLALLDIMLPDLDGFALCQKIRETHMFPIIMLTAKGEDLDKIKGLTVGADDYVTKPFNPLEVVARVRTQLRRYTQYNAAETANPAEYDADGLYICPETHICKLYGKPLALTPIEFEILWYLCERRGRIVSSEELFEAVWGEKYLDSSNTVMAHIARLREKMGEQPRKPKFIKTVWGVGYKIDS